MSEEEKKAIEYWKRDIELYHCNTQLASEHYAQIVLNLIEKQQKELEQEKEKNKELEIELSTRDNINVDKLVEKYKYYKRLANSYQANCISKDKIKELLENEIIDICGFKCIAVEDIQNLLEV